jgi:hypothetical protein
MSPGRGDELDEPAAELRGTHAIHELRRQFLAGAASGSESAGKMCFSAERLSNGEVRFSGEADRERGWREYAKLFFGDNRFRDDASSEPLKGIFVGTVVRG